jgi:signal transduction histidine kinase
MNNIVNRNTWQPFYDLLERMKLYDSEKTKIIRYEPTGISEFNELGKGVEKMTEKIYQDYLSQKEFNENSSHELQTPLAIMKNKLELLIQSPNLKEQEMELIQSIFEAIRRLSMLNKGLILISKIENRQFSETEKVSIDSVVSDLIQLMEEQIQEREINTEFQIGNNIILYTNPVLIEILLSNLISNSIKHNINRGNLKITLTGDQLILQNTGKALSRPASSMFDRFKKDSVSENSVGLGLAIVKKICEMLEFEIEYTNEDSQHTTVITFFPLKDGTKED